jgi:AcrR family transcriptional regulator
MAEDARERLIDAAGQAFAERGFEGASVRDICGVAGANVASVNYHFGDKQSLYVACLERAQCSEASQTLHAADPTLSPEARLHAFIRGMLAAQGDPGRPPWHNALMLREMAHPTAAAAEVLERYIRPLADALREIIEQIVPGVSATPHAGWPVGFSVVSQVLFYAVHRPVVRLLMGDAGYRALDLDDLADHITRFSLAALGRGPAIGAHTAPLQTTESSGRGAR